MKWIRLGRPCGRIHAVKRSPVIRGKHIKDCLNERRNWESQTTVEKALNTRIRVIIPHIVMSLESQQDGIKQISRFEEELDDKIKFKWII